MLPGIGALGKGVAVAVCTKAPVGETRPWTRVNWFFWICSMTEVGNGVSEISYRPTKGENLLMQYWKKIIKQEVH